MAYKLPEKLEPVMTKGYCVVYDFKDLGLVGTSVFGARELKCELINALRERQLRLVHIDPSGVYCEFVDLAGQHGIELVEPENSSPGERKHT